MIKSFVPRLLELFGAWESENIWELWNCHRRHRRHLPPSGTTCATALPASGAAMRSHAQPKKIQQNPTKHTKLGIARYRKLTKYVKAQKAKGIQRLLLDTHTDSGLTVDLLNVIRCYLLNMITVTATSYERYPFISRFGNPWFKHVIQNMPSNVPLKDPSNEAATPPDSDMWPKGGVKILKDIYRNISQIHPKYIPTYPNSPILKQHLESRSLDPKGLGQGPRGVSNRTCTLSSMCPKHPKTAKKRL